MSRYQNDPRVWLGVEKFAHSSPDVKSASLRQPEAFFTSPIRSRPCPGRLFLCAHFIITSDQMSFVPLFTQHSRSWRDNRYVYPVISRRSKGVSIGINLNPDKICNFDCIYC